jgi:hypothetical protein
MIYEITKDDLVIIRNRVGGFRIARFMVDGEVIRVDVYPVLENSESVVPLKVEVQEVYI